MPMFSLSSEFRGERILALIWSSTRADGFRKRNLLHTYIHIVHMFYTYQLYRSVRSFYVRIRPEVLQSPVEFTSVVVLHLDGI